MKKQNYLCVDLKTYTQETIRKNHAIFGMMEMTDEDEQFEFQETPMTFRAARRDVRNPKMYEGPIVSLVHKRNGNYQFHVRELSDLPRTTTQQLAYVRALSRDVMRALMDVHLPNRDR